MKKKNFRGWGLASAPFVFVVWFIVAAIYNNPLILPGPISVFQEFIRQLADPEYYAHIGISLYRLTVGFSIAMISAFVVGTAAGVLLPFREFIRPMVTFFQATPPLGWVPLLILVLDLGNAPMIAVIVIASFFPIAVNVIQGMDLIKESYIRAALSFGANRWQLARHVFLPAVMPSAFSGIVVGFGIAWRSLVAAEMIGGDSGIGWLIAYSGQIANSKLVMVGIITIGILAVAFEMLLLKPLQKRFASWAPRS